MNLTLHKQYIEDTLNIAKRLNSEDESSYQASYQITRGLVLPNKIFYIPRQVDILGKKCHNDGIAQFYGERKDKCLFFSEIEYKKGYLTTSKIEEIICQLLAYHMPFQTKYIDDFQMNIREVDKFRFFEMATEKQYGLIKLYNPKVKEILQQFEETFFKIGSITACKASNTQEYRIAARKLANFVEIWDIEDVEDHEIVAMMYRDYCSEKNIELTINFIDEYGVKS